MNLRNLAAMILATWISAFTTTWFHKAGLDPWHAMAFVVSPACVLAAMALRFPGDPS